MNIDLTGKIALVTGSTSGIGFAIASCMARHGAQVYIHAHISEDAAQGSLDTIRQINPKAGYIQADLRESRAAQQLVNKVKAHEGRLDLLVNNAGIQHVSAIDEFPDAKWDEVLAVNLSSAFHTIKAVLPMMKAHGFGRIINIASAHGKIASPFKSAYVAAKHGIIGLTKTVALELGSLPITCNSICPGYVRTELVEQQIEDQARAHDMEPEAVIAEIMLKNQPTGRFVQPEEIGALCVFLASDYAVSITGAALDIDGGWTAR